MSEGPAAATNSLLPKMMEFAQTEDAMEGIQSFIERRKGCFTKR